MVSVKFFITEFHHCILHGCLGHERTEKKARLKLTSLILLLQIFPPKMSLIHQPSLLRAALVSPKEQMVKLQQLLLLRSLHPVCGFRFFFQSFLCALLIAVSRQRENLSLLLEEFIVMPEKAPSSHQPHQEHHTHLPQSPGPHVHRQLLLREQNSHGFRHLFVGKVLPSLTVVVNLALLMPWQCRHKALGTWNNSFPLL